MRHIAPYLNIFKDVARFFRGNRHIVILEIGVARGHSTQHFLEGLKKRKEKGGSGTLYSIDIEPCYDNVKSDIKDEWKFIQGDSKTVEWNLMIDILFIDGDHSYEGAKADYEKYIKFVEPGGLILMHDVTHNKYGVNQAWNEIKDYPKIVWPLNGTGLGIIHKI